MVINDLQKASECQVIMAFMIVGKIRNAVRCNVMSSMNETEEGDV